MTTKPNHSHIHHQTGHAPELQSGYRFNRKTVLLVAGFVAAVGFVLLLAHAAGTFVAAEAESGTRTGPVATVSDTTASGNSAIVFNAPVVTPPPPPPPCPAGQTGTPPNCVTPPTDGPVPCPLTIAAKACWAANTGVPKAGGGRWTEAQIIAGQSPLVHTVGNRTITVPGTIIDNQWIDGCIAVKANNVIIRNSLIRSNGAYCAGGNGTSNTGPAAISNGANEGAMLNLQIIDSEVDAGNTDDSHDYSGIGAGNYSLLRVNVHGTTHTIWAGSNVTVRESFIHDVSTATVDRHNETIDMDSSNHVVIDHNWISVVNGNNTQTQTAAIQAGGSWGPSHDNIIRNNFLEGGQGTDLLIATAAYNTTISGNRMSPHSWPAGYSYDYQRNPGNSWTDNRDSETLVLINR